MFFYIFTYFMGNMVMYPQFSLYLQSHSAVHEINNYDKIQKLKK